MAVEARPEIEKIAEIDGPPELGFDAWKRTKVETGLEQSKDRDKMIAADKMWRELGLER